jgi:NTP pyrophosphatase (non-canonical NTP hydrolase)
MRTERVLDDVFKERQRQNKKWGEQSHDPGTWLAILSEEIGEVSRGILGEPGLREELVQVAAVAVAWIENLDREIA